jgi:hypothetical protein
MIGAPGARYRAYGERPSTVSRKRDPELVVWVARVAPMQPTCAEIPPVVASRLHTPPAQVVDRQPKHAHGIPTHDPTDAQGRPPGVPKGGRTCGEPS